MKKFDKILAMITLFALALLSGCAGTTSAYKAADGLEETAYVMNQHYLALVTEANRLADTGDLEGSSLRSAQKMFRSSRPVLKALSNAARAYAAVGSAYNQEALTVAIAAAAGELSNLLNLIRNSGGSARLFEDVENDLEPLLA